MRRKAKNLAYKCHSMYILFISLFIIVNLRLKCRKKKKEKKSKQLIGEALYLDLVDLKQSKSD